MTSIKGNSDQKRKLMQVLKTVSAGIFVLVVFGNGCSEGGFFPKEGTSDQSSQSLESAICKSPTDIEVIPGAKTAAVVSSNDIVKHLSSCLGLSEISSLTDSVYKAKVGSVSTYGAVNSLTPPMMIAVTSIAGEICSDLMDQESTAPRIFSGIDLGASSLPNSNQLSGVIQNIAASCWDGYTASSEEEDILLSEVSQSVGTSEPNAAKKSGLIICTAMLSSLNAILK